MPRAITCKQCGQRKEHQAHGLCKYCYYKKKRQHRRNDLIQMLGGKCAHCGYDKHTAGLAFHHPDPTAKEGKFTSIGLDRPWRQLVREAKQCILLCHNCHRVVHYNLLTQRHPNQLRYERRKMKLLHYRCKGDIKCEMCGYKAHPTNFMFHHNNPKRKSFVISKALERPRIYPWGLLQTESKKCAVLCHNCHHEIHFMGAAARRKTASWYYDSKTGQALSEGHCTQTTLSEFALSPS